MSSPTILTESHGRVGLIRLNRPAQLNALNDALMDALGAALLAFDANDETGAILITGSDKAFAAGADIDVMDGALQVRSRGKVAKFVETLQQLSFNARSSCNRAESVTYVTERAVFVRAANGLLLTEVAPGIDVQQHILDEIPFPIEIAPGLQRMDAALFRPPVA